MTADTLTAVQLHYESGRRNYRLLFGKAERTNVQEHRHGLTLETAYFAPGSIFALDLWDTNDYGTIQWEVFILEALAPDDHPSDSTVIATVPQVNRPVAVLLHTKGAKRCRAALHWLRLVEAAGDPTARPRAYYQTRDLVLNGSKLNQLTPLLIQRLVGGTT